MTARVRLSSGLEKRRCVFREDVRSFQNGQKTVTIFFSVSTRCRIEAFSCCGVTYEGKFKDFRPAAQRRVYTIMVAVVVVVVVVVGVVVVLVVVLLVGVGMLLVWGVCSCS